MKYWLVNKLPIYNQKDVEIVIKTELKLCIKASVSVVFFTVTQTKKKENFDIKMKGFFLVCQITRGVISKQTEKVAILFKNVIVN